MRGARSSVTKKPSSNGDTSGGRISKKASEERRTAVFLDESGFYPLPAAVRTYAPVGQTPVLREYVTRDHLSAIGAITPAGKLFLHVREKPWNSAGVARFLKHLLRVLSGLLLILWDGSPIHRGPEVRALLASPEGARIQVERLPGYAPDLNPAEFVWRHLKYADLKNVASDSLAELRVRLDAATRRLRQRPGVVSAFVRHLDRV
ncbi:MAG: transposase [Minicystis sp.]